MYLCVCMIETLQYETEMQMFCEEHLAEDVPSILESYLGKSGHP